MKWLLPALLLALASTGAQAQIHGVPPSVTSLGGGKSMFNPPGVPASVTSLGPNGFNSFPTCCLQPLFPLDPNPPRFPRRHFHPPVIVYGFPAYNPYPPVIVVQTGNGNDTGYDDEDGGGPTIFDRRGPRRRYVEVDDSQTEPAPAREPALRPAPAAAPAVTPASPAAPVETAPAEQPKTVLVFHDGHKEEVQNYAIVGDQLFDFTAARRKIALAQLDLPATTKANDERGLDFSLPVAR